MAKQNSPIPIEERLDGMRERFHGWSYAEIAEWTIARAKQAPEWQVDWAREFLENYRRTADYFQGTQHARSPESVRYGNRRNKLCEDGQVTSLTPSGSDPTTVR